MKKIIIALSFLFLTFSALSQTENDTIVVAPGVSGLHFYHIMQDGETLAHISQEYDISKDRILAANDHKEIKPYDIIKVPLKKEDVVQSGKKSEHIDLQPLYHKVSQGETLFRIGKLYSNIPLKNIKSWNNIQGNSIHPDQYLIVGWFKPHQNNKQQENVDHSSSDIASTKTKTTDTPNTKPKKTTNKLQTSQESKKETKGGHSFLNAVISSERERIQHPSANQKTKKAVSVPLLAKDTESKRPDRKPAKNDTFTTTPLLKDSQSQKKEEKELKKPSPKETPEKEKDNQSMGTFEKMLNKINHSPKEHTSSSTTSIATQPSQKKAESKEEEQPTPIIKKEKAPSKPEKTKAKVPDSSINKPTPKKDSAALHLAQKSAFSGLFTAQTKNENLIQSKKGAAGWFKSNIQPDSKKYYALCDNLPRGTIIKVINPINNKFIFAKVLSPIPKNKENYNLIVKLSDAAKNDLGISQSRFWSKIVFPKIN